MYVLLSNGDACTVDPLVALNPVEGDQLKLIPPKALILTVSPWQMNLSFPADILGSALIVTVKENVFVHPVTLVPVTV
jgi:hypothetical protein